MKYEEIVIGRKYLVAYKDPNYPCRCPCHSNEFVKHCMPCCYDNSYHGEAVCIGFVDGLIIMSYDNRRLNIVVPPESVIQEIL